MKPSIMPANLGIYRQDTKFAKVAWLASPINPKSEVWFQNCDRLTTDYTDFTD